MSSTVIAKNVQIGADGTASNNFTIFQPATPDGTLRIGNGNTGITSSAVALTSAGNVGIGTGSPSTKFTVSGNANLTGNFYTPDYGYIGNSAGTFSGINTGFQTLSGGSGYLLAFTNGNERMRIDSSGNVGIGTSSPDAKLDVTSAGSASAYTVSAVIQDGTYPASGNPTLEFNGFIGGNGYRSGVGSIGGQSLAFYTPSTYGVAPTERARITNGGGFVVGGTTLTSGSGVFQVNGGPFPIWAQGSSSGYCQGALVSASGTDSGPGGRGQGVYMWNQGNNTTWYMGTVYSAADTWYLTRKAVAGFQDDAAQSTYAKMWVTSSGVAFQGNNSSTWSTVSDARVKEDVQTIENGLDVVLALRPVEYFNKITKKREENFIAQEYEQVLAGHVSREKPTPGEQEFVTDEILRLNPNLVPYLVSAIQEQQAIITALTARVTALDTRLTSLEGTQP